MYCPACGVAAAAEEKFCRACGMHLEVVYFLVAEHLQPEHHSAPRAKRSMLQNFGVILSLGGSLWLLLLALVIMVMRVAADSQERNWTPLWSQLALGASGMLFIGLCFVWLPRLYRKIFLRPVRETANIEFTDSTRFIVGNNTKRGVSGKEHTPRSLDSVSSH